MRTFRFQEIIGFREARLIGNVPDTPRSSPDESAAPPASYAEVPEAVAIDPVTSEALADAVTLGATDRRMAAMDQERARREQIRERQQVIVDTILENEPTTMQEANEQKQLLRDAHKDLEATGYRMVVERGVVTEIKPYVAPKQKSPDEVAKRRRLEQLTYEIRHVEKQIRGMQATLRNIGGSELVFRNAALRRGRMDAQIISQSYQSGMRGYGPELSRLLERHAALVREFYGVRSGEIPVRASVPGMPTPAGNGVERGFVNPMTTPYLRNDLQNMYPALTREIEKLPPMIRDPIAIVANDMNNEDLAIFEAICLKMDEQLSKDQQMALGRLLQPDGTIAIPDNIGHDSDLAAAVQFFNSLTEPQRKVYEKIFREIARVSKEINASSEGENEAKRQKIDSYVRKWQNAKTDEEKQMAEGFLLLEGVDVDASDFDRNKIVMIPEDERFFSTIMGLMKIFLVFIDKLSGKKTTIDKQMQDVDKAKKDQVPATELSSGERAKDLKEVKKKLAGAQESEKKLSEEIDEKEKKLKEPDADPDGVLRRKVTELKELLKGLRETVATLQARVNELEKAQAGAADENKKKDEKLGDK